MNHIANTRFVQLIMLLLVFLVGTSVTQAQTTPFTYQGRLTDGGGPATGAYDLQFKLYDALVSGIQIGATATFEDVAVSVGSFTVTLDFGAAAFPGANRWLEVGVRPGVSTGAFTALSPLQRITSAPYAIKSLSAAAADGLSVACVNCVTSSQIGSLPANSGNYIQNTATLQASSNFNISGNGLIGGNVGIGTTNPSAKLEVGGSALLYPTSGPGTLAIRNRTNANYSQVVFLDDLGTYRGYLGYIGANAGLGSRNDTMEFGSNGKHITFMPNAIEAMRLTVDGNVGIGTTNPAEKLSVVASGNHALYAKSDIGIGVWGDSTSNSGVFGSSSISTGVTYGVQGLSLSSAGAGVYGRNDKYHGVEGFSTNGTGVAGFNNSLFGAVFGGNSGSGPGVYGQTASTVFNTAGVFGEATAFSGTVVGVYGRANNDPNGTGVAGFGRAVGGYFQATASGGISLIAAGTAQVNVLQIMGGSDMAEHFDVVEEVKPGLVVAIDPDHPGRLSIARSAYNRRVAGVISGANNLDAGMLLPDLPGAKNSLPVALSGRVWVYCDATRSAIQPGDLLTTSNTPGHAMKVTNHTKAQGAIIGKAMTGLKSGRGLVLVLVTLQ